MKNYFKQIKLRFVGWDTTDVFITLITIAAYVIRGTYQRFYFNNARGLVMVGKGVTLRYSNHLLAGKDLIIEEYAEVNCLSTRNVTLGDRVTIGRNAIIRPSNSYGGPIGEGMKIGNNSNIGAYNYVGCSGFIDIGNDVMIGPRVGLYAENHNFSDTNIPIKDQGVTKKFIKIEDDCWIGANVIIVAGVTIGRGSVVAAGSVVTKDVPPYSVAAGSPSSILKKRK
ncbi:hypothetical protein LCGC14_0570840 [marine sediment metagenome]|uniref:Acetyltransferase n=1 Tax=marine sediment metagenome TaxID=412755 RepID=A0A0F9S2V9_9ZZZZ